MVTKLFQLNQHGDFFKVTAIYFPLRHGKSDAVFCSKQLDAQLFLFVRQHLIHWAGMKTFWIGSAELEWSQRGAVGAGEGLLIMYKCTALCCIQKKKSSKVHRFRRRISEKVMCLVQSHSPHFWSSWESLELFKDLKGSGGCLKNVAPLVKTNFPLHNTEGNISSEILSAMRPWIKRKLQIHWRPQKGGLNLNCHKSRQKQLILKRIEYICKKSDRQGFPG